MGILALAFWPRTMAWSLFCDCHAYLKRVLFCTRRCKFLLAALVPLSTPTTVLLLSLIVLGSTPSITARLSVRIHINAAAIAATADIVVVVVATVGVVVAAAAADVTSLDGNLRCCFA